MAWRDAAQGSPLSRLLVRRERRAAGGPEPATDFVAWTGGSQVPRPLLARWVPDTLGELGQKCTCVWGSRVGGEWSYRVSGRLDGVDLGTLLAQRLPSHEFSGTARLEITDACYARGAWQSIAGVLDARNGRISQSIVKSLDTLGLKPIVYPDDPKVYEYDFLTAEFSLDASGLRICGTEKTAQGLGVLKSPKFNWFVLSKPASDMAKRPIPLETLAEAIAPGRTATETFSFLPRFPRPGHYDREVRHVSHEE
jgi:hypothetical protein